MKSEIKRASKYSSPTLKRQATAAVGGGATSWGGYAGNLATTEYLSSQSSQTMTVSEPQDLSEREADSTADRVMRVISRSPRERGDGQNGIQRSADGVGGSEVSPGLQSGIESAKSGPAGSLPAQLAGSMGGAMGCTFNGVRVHNDSSSHAMSRDLQAEAFTSGSDIFFGKGAYQPDSHGGQRLIAHELSHVAQGQDGLHRWPWSKKTPAPGGSGGGGPAPAPVAPTAGPMDILANPLIVRLIKLIVRIKKTPIADWAGVDVGKGDKLGKTLDAIGSGIDTAGGLAGTVGMGADIGGHVADAKDNEGAKDAAGKTSGVAGIVSGGATVASGAISMANTSMDINDARKNRFSNRKEALTKGGKNADLANMQKGDYEGVDNQGSNVARLVGSGMGMTSGALGIGGSATGLGSKEEGDAADKTAKGLNFAGAAAGFAGAGINAGADIADYIGAQAGRKGDKAKLEKARVKVETALGTSTLAQAIKDKLTTSLKKNAKTSIVDIKKFVGDNKTALGEEKNKPLKNALSQYIMSLQMEHTSAKDASEKGWSMGGGLLDTGISGLGLLGSGFSSFAGKDNTGLKIAGTVLSGIATLAGLGKSLYQTVKKSKAAAMVNSDSRKDKYRQRVLDVVGAMQAMPDILGAGIERADFEACANQAGQSRTPAPAPAPAPATGGGGGAPVVPTAVAASADALSKLNGLSGQITEYKDFYDNMNGTVNMLDLCTSVEDLSSDAKLAAADMSGVAQAIAGGLGL